MTDDETKAALLDLSIAGGMAETDATNQYLFLTDSRIEGAGLDAEQVGRVVESIGGQRDQLQNPASTGLMPGRITAPPKTFTSGYWVPRSWSDAWT